jgi:Domain of unknown function (DUF4129)
VDVDITSEEVQADDRAEDEWRRLALQLRGQGDLRLALRALYLSTLAALAQDNLIVIARGKSNLDYLRELQRRGKRFGPKLPAAFRANLLIFESCWYGTHLVTDTELTRFEENMHAIRIIVSIAEPPPLETAIARA